jgi:hypothetical protein
VEAIRALVDAAREQFELVARHGPRPRQPRRPAIAGAPSGLTNDERRRPTTNNQRPTTKDYRYSLNGSWQSCLRRKLRNFL